MDRLIRPRRLDRGSRIAIVAPAGTPKPDRLRKGIAILKQHGYEISVAPQVRKKLGYLAGDDKTRAGALMNAFSDNTIDAIFAGRGGYGCLRLLPFLDFKVIKSCPKPLVGYSDLTVLLLAIYKKCDMITFHGPMVSTELGKSLKSYTLGYFFKALEQTNPLGIIRLPAAYRLGAFGGGKAAGPIVGGNLSLMARMTGTGFLPSFKNKIIFMEDTEEEPYRLDAYLAQLFLATDITQANGFIIGEMTRTEPRYGHSKSWTAMEVVKDYLAKLGKPVITNFPCGHGKEKITIPIGIKVAIDADKKIVEFKEAGVK
jgi:muramoyltetrapeptide carboxypeptidase